MLTKWQIDKKATSDIKTAATSFLVLSLIRCHCSMFIKAKRLATLCQSKQRIHSQHEVPPARVHSSTAQFQVQQSQRQSDFMSQVREH